ncbi:MAG: recombinase family protein [Synergistaceae bacterium]|jgi:DNA invertase Pin-like site-specific DNA recombinase|nr:recombinase family protein [Synergistaceae bacterium]
MTNKVFGYIRVSTQDQNLDRQRIALAPFNIPDRNLYVDTQSGKDFKRPAYQQLMSKLKRDDLLIIKSIDRLGRNYQDVIDQWRHITRGKKADIRVLDMPLLDTTYHKNLLGTFISDLVLQVLSFTAQSERENLRQRQAEGIAAARARGQSFGKEPITLPQNFEDLYRRWRSGEHTAKVLASRCGISLRTLYNRTKALRAKANTTPAPRDKNK